MSKIHPASGRKPLTKVRFNRGFTVDGKVHGFATEPSGLTVARSVCGRDVLVHTVYDATVWPKMTDRCSRCVAVTA